MLLLTLRETYALNGLSSFKNLRRKGGKFDHRPGRPKVLLRHWMHFILLKFRDLDFSYGKSKRRRIIHSAFNVWLTKIKDKTT